MAPVESRAARTTPPPPPDSYATEVRGQADKLECFARRIMARVSELRESADRLEKR